MSDCVLLVPARMNSTRLPNKLALDLAGEPVLSRTLKQALKTNSFSEIVLATDSPQLANIAHGLDVRVLMTPSDFINGSERCAYALSQGIIGDFAVVLQADEPFIDPSLLDTMASSLRQRRSEMVSAMHPINDWYLFDDHSVVKVICDQDDRALYFSRSPIPHLSREEFVTPPAKYLWGHIGVYGFTRSALIEFPKLQSPSIEKFESLEQLRALYAGWRIQMVRWTKPLTGINTLSDLTYAREWIASNP